MSEFNFNETFKPTTWGIDRLAPHNHFIPIIAQSGVGKSLVIEDMITCILCEIPWCGFHVIGGNVLLIDQDTPTSTLKKRLQKLMKGHGIQPKYKLFVESMQGYGLEDISDLFNSYHDVKYIFCDSLHSLCHTSKRNKKKLKVNQTDDMQSLSELKHGCLVNDCIVFMTHHISEKTPYSINDLMTGTTNNLSMGNSAIMQQADTYYIIGASAIDGRMTKAFIRPVSKRESIPVKPFVVDMIQNDDEIESEFLRFAGYYETGLNEAQQDILTLFETVTEPLTVKQVFDRMGGQHGINKVREELKELYKLEKLSFSRQANNLFQYSKIEGGE